MTQQSVTTGWRYAALTAAIVAALGIAACSKKDEPAAGAPAASATAAAASAAPAVTTDAELMTKAKTAEGEKRLYAPAGDNAIEYYLALRQRNPKDAIANNALQDLFPYAMIATEQNLKKGDEPGRVEAARIFALLERVDTNAPSLPRLRATMQTVAASELKAQQDEAKKTQDALAKKTADDAKAVAAAAALKGQPPPQTVAPPPVQTQAAAPPPKQVQQQPVQAPPPRPAQNEAPAQTQQEAPAPKPARAGGALPDVVSSVQPTYPRDALRDGVSGEVTVAFTVNPDGSVSGASVVSSNPRRVFDNAALEAIKKWRFEAPGAPVTGRRTFAFSPGQ